MKKILRGFFVSFFLINVSHSGAPVCAQKSNSHTAPSPALAGGARQAKSAPLSVVSSLDDALRAAYYYDVELETMRTVLKQAVEGVALANSEWNPSLSVNADQRAHTSRERSKQSFDFTEYENARIGSNSRGNGASLSLQAKQNLFSGGGTVARQEKSDAEFKASVARLSSQEQDTFIKVIEAYTQSALAQEVLDLEKKNETYFKGLLDQAKVRYEVGDQRLADVATAKAELASAVISVSKAQAALDEKRAKLQALINIPIAPRLKMPPYYTENPKNLDQVKSISLKNNPLLVEGCYRERAARYNTSSVFAGLLPTVDLSGGIGPSVRWEENKRSPDYLSNRSKRITREANVMVSVTIPLVTGGGVQSNYRKSELEVKQARLNTEGYRRSIEQQCTSLFSFFETSQQNVASAKVALDSNQTALDAARTEYDLGVLTLLDMIRIEQNWINSYRTYVTIKSDLVVYSYQVLRLTGKLTARDLGLNVCLYDPCTYYNRYRNAWFSLGKDEAKTPLFPCTETPPIQQ